ncbi:Pleckstrin homology domain-containing family G member 1 [Atta colombica]|uniref:Pleckstrin homology domain-containing family G member 1 n=1 Tax=Atta colombica TaxID=520822 RepID=A0A195BMX6_9HYME|nr:Pleckstrin homology domain-containing family G member 1 [Atta colombica]
MVECLDEVAGSHGRKSAVAHPIIREVSAKCIREVSRETAIAILSRYYYDGTSTDLVPQLLGMFDELARRSDGYDGDRVVLPSSCGISAVLQKRLSMVSVAHRNSVFGQLCTNGDLTKPMYQDMLKTKEQESEYNEVVADASNNTMLETIIPVVTLEHEGNGETIEESTGKPMYERRETNGLTTPLRYNKRRRNGRPLSGSSIASSTSSSSCSNQGNTSAANPYLASVESLADTCASSQGSADSGVVTVSKGSCRILNDDNEQRRNSAEEDPLCHGPRYCDPHRNPVERVLLEIVDTEAIYVEHLRQVIQGYLIFWRDNPPSFSRRLRLGDLFSNIEDIFEFNREFLWEIEKCGLNPVCVANTFIKRNSGFKVYTEYCTNYPRTVSVLTDLMGQEETASSFRERQKALSHQLPLGSFLLKPVQRILKYHLLLENLSKEYGADCDSRENEAEGRSAIEAALAAMTGIAKHINAMKRRHEHAVRVQEIQSLLYGWLGPDLTTSGELVAEGRFRMRGAKAPRHAFLFDRMLLLTKKKEDGLLVYKAHIMCSNLMLIESIPGEPLSFHVIPFDNPRLQYTLQARNLEQKREWTLQIKRVILENYNAVIPSHARQLVLQLGQTQQEDDALTDKGSAKKHSAPPEYLEKRKQERERRRSETSLKQKFMRGVRRSDTTMEDSPTSSCKNDNEDVNDSRDPTFNRSSDVRASKVKDRFTGWRRKSEPGFQSYVCLNHLDEEQKEATASDAQSTTIEVAEEAIEICTKEENQTLNSSSPAEAKDNNEQHAKPAQTVEEIVSHILMQNQEFQKLLEKQQTNSIINVRQQRFNKRISADTSDESDSENANYASSISHNNSNNRLGRARALHRERLIRTNNAWNLLSSAPARENQQPLQLLYDNLKTTQKSTETLAQNGKTNQYERQAFKRQSIVTESKVIKTALRIRENSTSTDNEEIVISPAKCMLNHRAVERKEINSIVMTERIEKDGSERCNDERSDANNAGDAESKGFGNYDNLQHVWEGLQTVKGDADGNDSPTQPAVWLTKLCEGLPTSPPKSGSLPRSFQINPNSQPSVTKSRFLQRDGKPMSERPFTIASDKPAEINLEDMERYASTCQPEGRIAKFPMPTVSTSSSTSTFFCSRLQGRLRNTMSTETLECNDEIERTRYFRSLNSGGKYPKKRTKQTKQHAREPSSDVEELMGCSNDQRIPQLYYKQGSSSLGARIAQSDYADPTILFAESKRMQSSSVDINQSKNTAESERRDCEEETDSNKDTEHHESETDSFYERSFETIENYADVDEAFRDSAIFSDVDEAFVMRQSTPATTAKMITMETAAAIAKTKIAPPVPAKKKQEMSSIKYKPNVAQKPDYLKIKSLLARGHPTGNSETRVTTRLVNVMAQQPLDSSSNNYKKNFEMDRDDVSVGQSQAGWVRKIVGQLQGHVET